MTDRDADLAPLDVALRKAVRDHFAEGEDADRVDVPAVDVLVALIKFAVDIAMSAPPGDARAWFMSFIRAVTRAAETSAKHGVPIGVALAEIYGEKLH